MQDVKIIKKQIRDQVLKLRSSLSLEEVSTRSFQIFDKVENLDEFCNSEWVMAYIDFRNEVSTKDFIKKCLLSGKRVTVPFVADHGFGKRELWSCEIRDIKNDLQIGTYGILEPRKEIRNPMDPSLLDMVIVPGVVFDETKQRIGYGAGFYDRFLKRISDHCLKVGVAFDLQIVKKIPAEDHDVPLDIIITEERFI